MALKSEFDQKSFVFVLVRSLIGVVIGAIPGMVYIAVAGQSQSAFGLGLLQLGATIGAFSMGLASCAATIVATLKNRGSGPGTSRAKRMQEYMHPESLPAIPPPSKPIISERAGPRQDEAEKTEVMELPVPRKAASTKAADDEPMATAQSEQSVYEDYDRG